MSILLISVPAFAQVNGETDPVDNDNQENVSNDNLEGGYHINNDNPENEIIKPEEEGKEEEEEGKEEEGEGQNNGEEEEEEEEEGPSGAFTDNTQTEEDTPSSDKVPETPETTLAQTQSVSGSDSTMAFIILGVLAIGIALLIIRSERKRRREQRNKANKE